ncbi:MAG: hypothetical protein Q4G33_14150 [bacterium]|nr:hypothetical protein [bacterium]
MEHIITFKLNEIPKGTVVIVSKISKGEQSLKFIELDSDKCSYRDLDVTIYEHMQKIDGIE